MDWSKNICVFLFFTMRKTNFPLILFIPQSCSTAAIRLIRNILFFLPIVSSTYVFSSVSKFFSVYNTYKPEKCVLDTIFALFDKIKDSLKKIYNRDFFNFEFKRKKVHAQYIFVWLKYVDDF